MSSPGAALLAAYDAALVEAELPAAALDRLPGAPRRDDPEQRERVDDLLRPGAVADTFRAARDAPPTADGEAARSEFRARARLYLERVRGAHPEARLVRDPWVGPELRLARLEDPLAREREYEHWLAQERARESRRAEGFALAEAAARDVGADSLRQYLVVEHPADLTELDRRFETGAIHPLDDAVAEAARMLRGVSGQHPDRPADEPRARALPRHAARVPRASIVSTLRGVAGALVASPLSGDLRILDGVGGLGWTEVRETLSWGPVVLIGELEGPAALGCALGRLGRAARGAFVAEHRGAAAERWCDPAFAHAAEVLFRRLILARGVGEQFGLERDAECDRALRFQEAVAPRLAWTYLHLALQSDAALGVSVGRPDDEVDRALRRAAGRAATLGDRLRLGHSAFDGAAALRGTVLALLLEERLLSRWGHGWFADARAQRFLRECWEAEPGATAESMADAADLGTMEPAPIMDRCRPSSREGR